MRLDLLAQICIHAKMRSWAVVPLIASFLLTGCKHHGSTDGGSRPVAGNASSVGADQAAAAKEQTDLLNLQTTEMETDVPADVQHAIPTFKEVLVRLSDDVLAGQAANATVAQVQQALNAVLPAAKAPNDTKATAAAKAAGKNEYDIPHKGEYGGEVKASVSDLQPGLLLVDASFGIQCGEDHVLLGYSSAGGKWRRVLRWQAGPYDKVSGAFGDMFLPVLLKPKYGGDPLLLVVHGTPWCSSTESTFAMDTFQVSASVATEKPFWHSEHSYRRADDVPPLAFSLERTLDGFEIRASVDDRIGDGINRVGIMRYALVGNTMRRTFPIAMNPRESISEWLIMPVEEARLFTDVQPGSTAWQMWEALTYEGKNESEAQQVPIVSYGEVRGCSDPEHYQVSLNTEVYSADNKTHTPGPTYYVQMQKIADGYGVRDAIIWADPSCNGPVIPMKSSGYDSQTAMQ